MARNVDSRWNAADAGRIDKNSVRCPRLTTLVSPVMIVTPASAAVFCMDWTILFKSEKKESLFDDKTGAQKKGLGSAHGEVVDRATDRQFSYVSAGEEDWSHHVAVRGKSPSRALAEKTAESSRGWRRGFWKLLAKSEATS